MSHDFSDIALLDLCFDVLGILVDALVLKRLVYELLVHKDNDTSDVINHFFIGLPPFDCLLH